MSYLWYLLGYHQEEEELDELKDKQKHLKYLCCKSIDTALPKLKPIIAKPPVVVKKKYRRKHFEYF